ncbi:hypothetical protein BDZ97DRAFT_1675867 [Flammula alnicola]|nr:hypothetical protein BDZ97DRAFT_1675867 [Flammula alnicola]
MAQRIVPNFGCPEGRLRPVDLDHIFKDADEPKDVSLQGVTLVPSGSARDNHWMICWPVGWASGYAVQRRVHIVKELLVPHLTNWGPMTKSASSTTAQTRLLVLARGVTLAQRKKLEAIGSETPVLEPDGAWNCQDWVITVLAAAEEEGLVAHEQWTKVVAEAQAGFD